jgi:uncharacterized protein
MAFIFRGNEAMRRLFALMPLLFALTGCVSLEQSLVFQPTPYHEGEWKTPTAPSEDARFSAADGTHLHGWFAEAVNPRAVVLYCHGNAGNISGGEGLLRQYCDKLHVSVLLFDYRGYGKSQGSPSEAGILQDARAARAWLAKRAGVAEKDIVLIGNSLGGGVAVDLASKDGARGLILENTFTSLPDVAASHFPLLPAQWLMQTRLDSASLIGKYHGPLLQTHGDADRVIPFEIGKKLFAAANEPKQFIAIPAGGHNVPQDRAYWQAVDAFFAGRARLSYGDASWHEATQAR